MGFIAGYVGRGGREDSSRIRNKVESYRILADDPVDSYQNAIIETRSGHLIRKYKKDYPVQVRPATDSEGNALVILGFLDSTEPGKLLNSGLETGGRSLEQSEGEFVCLLSERQSGTIHIVNDRFASRPFYILVDQGNTFFSSNMAFLLYLAGGKQSPDVLGWFQVFATGHTIGDRTTLGSVQRLKPGSHIIVSPEGIVQKRTYWQFRHTPDNAIQPASHSLAVYEAFERGARRRSSLVGSGILALSGGLDSRLVAAALPKGSAYSAFTFVNSTESAATADTNGAAAVCAALGLSHHVQPVTEKPFSLVGKDVIALTGGQRPLQHMAIVMLYIQELGRVGGNFMLGGGPGDVIAGSKIPAVEYLDPAKSAVSLANFCQSLAMDDVDLGRLFRDDIMKQFRPKLSRSVRESVDETEGPTVAHRITAWGIQNRWPGFTFTSVFHNHPDAAEAFCHLDYRFCDLMASLPADWLFERNFYAYMIQHQLPLLRHIPYANTGLVLDGRLKTFDYRVPASRRAYRFAKQFVPRAIIKKLRPPAKGAATYHHSLIRNDAALLAAIEETLHGSSAIVEMLDRDKSLAFVRDFRDDKLDGLTYDQQTELLGGLATMCLSYRHLNI